MMLPRKARSTIEVARFRYFVSERRDFLTPKSSEKKLCRLGPWDYSPRRISIFAESQFSGEVWSSSSEEPQKRLGAPLS